MICKPVIFRELYTGENIHFMGIRVGDEGVICAETGDFLELENVDIIAQYPDWIDFTFEIAGDDYYKLLSAYNEEVAKN